MLYVTIIYFSRYDSAVQQLYHGIRCSQCGLRFTGANLDKYSYHLDWHFRQNRRGKDDQTIAQYRAWYFLLPVSFNISYLYRPIHLICLINILANNSTLNSQTLHSIRVLSQSLKRY